MFLKLASVTLTTLVMFAGLPTLSEARVLKQNHREYTNQDQCVEQARLVSQRFLKMVDNRARFSGGERVIHDQRPGKFVIQTYYQETGHDLVATIVCQPGGQSTTTHQTVQ
jgi:hypothetical protein